MFASLALINLIKKNIFRDKFASPVDPEALLKTVEVEFPITDVTDV